MSTQAGKKLGLLACRPEAVQRLSDALEGRGWVISQSVVLANDQVVPKDSVLHPEGTLPPLAPQGSVLSPLEGEHVEGEHVAPQGHVVAGLFESASALVVDLDGADNSQLQHLNKLVSAEVRPVLFNDSSHDQDWLQHLHTKLTDLLRTTEFRINAEPPNKLVGDDDLSDLAIKSDRDIANASVMSGNVWLLNSSLGGPEALREFFSTLSSGLPISFIVMQRIAKEHIDVLVNHLKQYTDYSMSVMNGPTALCDGALILVADGSCFTIDNQNTLLPDTISLCERVYDQMMTVLAERYGVNANAIVFSAIGEDGAKGCQKILASGGRVWLQEGQVGYASRLAQQPRAPTLSRSLPRAWHEGQVLGVQGDETHRNEQRLEIASAIELAQRLNDLYKH